MHTDGTRSTTATRTAAAARARRWVGLGAAATVAATTITIGATGAPAAAQPTLAHTTFDPHTTGWQFYSEQSAAEFNDTFDKLAGDGQILFDLDIDTTPEYRVGAVYRPNPDGRAWAVLPNRTVAEFNSDIADYGKAGYRVSGVESHQIDTQQRYATHFVENVEGLNWSSSYGLASADLKNEYAKRRRSMLPVDVDGYPTADGLRYGLVWEENIENLDWKLRWDMTNEELQTLSDTYAAQGFRFLVIDSYPVGDSHRHAAIWVDNVNGRGHAANADMSATDFRNQWNRMTDMGYRLDDYETYTSGGEVRYDAVWRQNDDKFDWRIRDEVDDEVKKFLEKFDVPGVGVSITHEGQIVYERGFGFQDVDAGVEYHAGTVNRLASVSKAVTGILAFDLLSDHPEVSLSDDVTVYLPSIPEHHTYTLGDTLANQSCIPSYPAPMKDTWTEHYDSAVEAVAEFMYAPLAATADDKGPCVPGSDDKYSTAAYTVACAMFEVIENASIDDIIVDRLTVPHGVPTLAPYDANTPNATVLYGTDNKAIEPDDLSWKTCGGGLQASAHDMAHFGIELLDDQILSATDREAMWTKQGGWAYGWNVGNAANAGERWFGKSGGQNGARTYWLIYPDDDITITVLTNRRRGGHQPMVLANQIGELMLATF